MLDKWRKRIEIAHKALLSADRSDPNVMTRAVTFTNSLLASMKVDKAHNAQIWDNTYGGKPFVFHDEDEKTSLALMAQLSQPVGYWFADTEYFSFGKGELDSTAQTGLVPGIDSFPASDEAKDKLRLNVLDICFSSMLRSHYSAKFNSHIAKHGEILQALFRLYPISDKNWKALGRESRIGHLNNIALAADHVMRSKARPSFMTPLCDINNSSRDLNIISDEPLRQYTKDESGKVADITLAGYRRKTGRIEFAYIEEENIDTTLDRDRCEQILVHEATHRFSHILRESAGYTDDQLLYSAAEHLEICCNLGPIQNLKTLSQDVVALQEYTLYRANVEEVTASREESRTELLQKDGVTPEKYEQLLREIYEGAAFAPEVLKPIFNLATRKYYELLDKKKEAGVTEPQLGTMKPAA